jgi:hypothetical protein
MGLFLLGVNSYYTMQGKLFRSYLLAITLFAVTTVYYILKYFIIGELYLAKSKIFSISCVNFLFLSHFIGFTNDYQMTLKCHYLGKNNKIPATIVI